MTIVFITNLLRQYTCAKCLGETTDKHLSFNQHGNSINTFFAEQHQVLSTEIFYEVMGRLIIYLHSLVTTQKKNMQSLQAVQRRVAWFIKNDYKFTCSVAAMLQDLEWPALEERTINATIICYLKFCTVEWLYE